VEVMQTRDGNELKKRMGLGKGYSPDASFYRPPLYHTLYTGGTKEEVAHTTVKERVKWGVIL